MSLKFNEIQGMYSEDRYKTMLRLEEIGGTEKLQPYKDSKHLVTIGAGYNLSDPIVLSRVLEVMGITSSNTDSLTMQKLISYLADDHPNRDNDGVRKDLRDILGRDFEFTSADQVYEVFNGTGGQDNGLAEIYEQRVDAWANKYSLSAVPNSKERLALLSLSYNGVLAESESLARAIKDGNRAEAWFEIRYRSNGDILPGIAKRRYYESELFGLYNDQSQLTPSDRMDEAKNIFRMLQLNRDEITLYDKTYSPYINAANNDYYWPNNMQDTLTQTVHDLAQSFELAKNNLIDLDLYYTLPIDITPSDYKSTDIYIDPGRSDSRETFDSNHNAILTGSERNDIIIGEGGSDRLEGKADKDLLIGGDGNDTLTGGQGDDILVGGKGFDTYIWSPGDGNDQIIEEKESNGEISGVIKIKNGQYDQAAAGLFELVDGQPNHWAKEMADGSILTITHNSPWKLITGDGSELLLGEDFESGDFGIGLEPEQPAATNVLTGTEGSDYPFFVFDSGTAQYVFTGNITGSVLINEHSFGYSNLADPPSLQINGAGGNDYLMGFAGKDSIEGGDGNDRIIGDGYVNDPDPRYNPWGYTGAADILRGGAGKDYISGRSGNDMMTGGEDQDFIEGGNENDTAEGDGGNDVIAGGLGNDLLSGGSGNDFLYGDSAIKPNFGPEGYEDSLHQINLASLYAEADYSAAGYPVSVHFQGFDVVEESGPGGDDFILGGSGNDDLYAGEGSDTLDGGTGNDRLIGGSGDDLYIFNPGNGADLIFDDSGADTLAFGSGIAFSNLSNFTRNGNDLVMMVVPGGDQLSFSSWYSDTMYQIERFTFADGTEINSAGLLAGKPVTGYGTPGNDNMQGHDGVDKVYGRDGNDILDGGSGTNFLNGGTDDDTYMFDRGSGPDLIHETDAADIIRFTDVNSEDLKVTRTAHDLILSINGTADKLCVAGWFDGADTIDNCDVMGKEKRLAA